MQWYIFLQLWKYAYCETIAKLIIVEKETTLEILSTNWVGEM